MSQDLITVNLMDPTRYLYVPLDVPKAPVDRTRLLEYYDSQKKVADQDFLAPLDFPWYVAHIRPDWLRPLEGEIQGSGWDPLFRELFPELVRVIEDFPFQWIDRIYILEQLKEVKPHQDVSRELESALGPSTFRAPLINDEPDRTFYLLKGSRKDGTLVPGEIYPILPESTQWFGMNNYKAMHGSHLPSPQGRKLMLCIWGRLDREKWLGLLERSVAKYPEYCL